MIEREPKPETSNLNSNSRNFRRLDCFVYGAVAAVYRHFGDNLKLGVGYNFADLSDDLTDVTYDNEDIFVNVIGKF